MNCHPKNVALILSLISLFLMTLWGKGMADQDYRSRTIYFMVADRFNPHHPYSPYVDPEYPTATNTINCFEQPCPSDEEWRRYWGGDIQGILERIQYLQGLHVSALWVTPLMENARAFEPGKGWGAAYHGYWVQNYDRVNPHFGSWDDINQLSRVLHSHGMRYVQDITLSDSNPSNTHVHGRLYRSSKGDQIFIDSYKNDYDPVNQARFYKHYQHDQRCFQADGKPDYEWTYWQLYHCLLEHLSGYNQHDPRLADYLIDAGKTWVDHGVDDFRLDAVKFIFPDFVAQFTNIMINHLRSLGRPSPYIVGEWSHGGVGDPKSLHFANQYHLYKTNILDFQLSLALNQFIGGAHEAPSQQLTAQGLGRFLEERVVCFHKRDTWQGTFIDNPDQIRTMVRLEKLGVGREIERERRMDMATVLLLTIRGIPIILYGDEQYLARYADCAPRHPEHCEVAAENVNSSNDDPYNRMGMTQWSEDTPAFKIIGILASLREQSPAVWQGAYRTLYADDDILVFERKWGAESVLVGVNRGKASTVSLGATINLAPGIYTGLLTHTSDVNAGNFLAVASNGNVTVHLEGLSSLVVRISPIQHGQLQHCVGLRCEQQSHQRQQQY
jgi:glycosidase